MPCGILRRGAKYGLGSRQERQPVFPGWYADPEGVVFGDTYWIYPTYSADYDEQTFMDCLLVERPPYTGRSTPGSSPTTR